MCINKAKREDTGKYTIKVTSEAGEDTYDIVVRVIDIPSQESVKNFNFVRLRKNIIAWIVSRSGFLVGYPIPRK